MTGMITASLNEVAGVRIALQILNLFAETALLPLHERSSGETANEQPTVFLTLYAPLDCLSIVTTQTKKFDSHASIGMTANHNSITPCFCLVV
jgi:hypothetical protein